MVVPIRSCVYLALVAAIALGGCGGSGESSASSGGDGQPTPIAQTVRLYSGSPEGLGPVVVDQEGRTLYVFDGDRRGSGSSACYDACTRTWIPLTTVSKPNPGDPRIHGSLLGTIERSEGTTQVTYNGWPLYRLVGESGAEALGVGRTAFGGTWNLLQLNGSPLEAG